MMENAVEEIGPLLKDRRKKLGLTLEDAEQHTRIRKSHLECIESNRFSELPGQVYVTGFLRVYARYLGLDSNSLLALLEDSPTDRPQPFMKPVAIIKHQSHRSRKPIVVAGLRSIVLVFLVVLVLGSAIYYLPVLFRDKPAVDLSTGQGKPVKETALLQTDTTVSSLKSEHAEPLEALKPTSTSAQAKSSQELDSLPILPLEGASLRMLAVADGSLVISLDDSEPRQYQLYDNLDLTWKVKRKVKIDMAGPSVARFWLDGQELDLGDLQTFQLNSAFGD